MKKIFGSGGVIIGGLLLGLLTGTSGFAQAHPEPPSNGRPIPSGPAAAGPANSQHGQGRGACSAWQDSFNTGALDKTRWVVASGAAPGAIPNLHYGDYVPGNVSLQNGLLSLTLTQQLGTVGTNPSGVLSHGALIYTKAACGYGTYEWTMRMSSSAICPTCVGAAYSGSVSAGFLYVNNSQTEIDFEFTATTPQSIWLVNWLNPNPATDPTSANEQYTQASLPSVTDQFHTYSFVWAPGSITYYIDGVLADTHTSNVPSAPAYFMINHWGTDSPNWGGYASLGTPRYFYISHASYAPAQ